MGITVFDKMHCQNNTDKKIMMNEGNKRLPPSVITFHPYRGGQKLYKRGQNKICALRAHLEIFPLLAKPIVRPGFAVYTYVPYIYYYRFRL